MSDKQIKVYEKENKIIVEVPDGDGGRIKLMFDPVSADRFGQGISNRARFLVAKTSDDPQRAATQTFNLEHIYDGDKILKEVRNQELSDDGKIARRSH